jgi:hypothetical protein
LRINAERGALVDNGARLIAVPDRQPAETAYVPSSRRYSAFVADTLARLAAGRPPAVSLKEFARATELIDQAYRR